MTVTLALSGAAGPSDAGTSGTATTDASGKFSFPNLPIGAYTLTFTRTGFTTKSVAVGNSVAAATILAVTMAADTTAGVDAPTFQIAVTSTGGVNDPFAVGFGTTVTVTLTNIADTSEPSYTASSFTYAWTIGAGITSSNPKGTYSFNTPPTTTDTSAAFNTMTLAQTKGVEVYPMANPIDGGPLGYPARLGVMGINPDETGLYSVGITISDPEGHNYSLSQTIQSTWQSTDLRNVPVGNPVYLQGDTFAAPNWWQQSPSFWKWPNTSWTWTVTTVPTGSAVTTATLGGASTQYPFFVPDVVGDYVLSVTETSSYADAGTTGLGLTAGPGPGGSYGTQTSTVTVHAGTWLGVMNGNDSTCTQCHTSGGIAPDMFTPWQNTNHASALKRKMDGLVGSHFGEGCLECHTTGWSEVQTAQTAANGGFFYEQSTDLGPDGGLFQYPNPMTSTSYSDMATNFPTLGALGGIQCENCHGPANGPASSHPGAGKAEFQSARITWSAQVCASCHEEATHHAAPGQWALTKHDNINVAQHLATVEAKTTAMGGGADPQGGAQFCARCHSAQGFAHYVKLLNNGATGRYDFITQDDQKLGAGNAPTTPWLSSIGLNNAQVESQTCQTCHDPHSNAAYGAAGVDCTNQANVSTTPCYQLRVYDGLPGLPNGMGAFSGVGEGALCMTCHNGRNGEHTDTVNSSPYAETPHDSLPTEALFGFDAFFVPRYNPSPHLAIKDTCATCHVKLPTDSETAAGYSGNHEFNTDLTICKNCHGSSNVDGAAIQAQVKSELATLGSAIMTAVTSAVKTANTAGGLCVQVGSLSDPNCTGGNCKSAIVPTAVPFPVPPSSVWIPQSGITTVTMSGADSTSVTINLSAGINIPYFDPQTMALIGTTAASKKLSVAIYTILTGVAQASCASGGVSTGGVVGTPASQLFPASGIPSKSIWNYATLDREGSYGIHNFPWTNAVLQATLAQIGAWTP